MFIRDCLSLGINFFVVCHLLVYYDYYSYSSLSEFIVFLFPSISLFLPSLFTAHFNFPLPPSLTSSLSPAVLHSNPPCLAVTLSSSLVKQKLLLSVDIRIGLVVASLEGVVKHRNEFVNKTLQLVEDDVLHSHHLLINHFELLL